MRHIPNWSYLSISRRFNCFALNSFAFQHIVEVTLSGTNVFQAWNMDFSIIIPVLNESHKVHRDIAAASLFLVNQSWRGEIIVVDDGSSDDTADVAGRVSVQPNVSLHIIRNEVHR